MSTNEDARPHSRRTFLTAAAAGAVAGGATITSQVALAAPSEIDEVWTRFLALCEEQRRLDRAWIAESSDVEQETLSTAIDAKCEAYNAVIAELRELPGCLDTTAILLMLEFDGFASGDDIVEHDHRAVHIALSGLRPHLTGVVAASAGDFLDNPERPLRQSPMWTYDASPEAQAVRRSRSGRA